MEWCDKETSHSLEDKVLKVELEASSDIFFDEVDGASICDVPGPGSLRARHAIDLACAGRFGGV